MIQLKECKIAGYPARTKENVVESDITIAFAEDFSTAGERLTRKYCNDYRRKYIPIDLKHPVVISKIANELLFVDTVIINIAGNGLYTLKYQQKYYDELLYDIFSKLLDSGYMPEITLIRSGGQSGIDEAGVNAADKLGIPALVLAPKGWIFRDINNQNIADEKQFKRRFQ